GAKMGGIRRPDFRLPDRRIKRRKTVHCFLASVNSPRAKRRQGEEKQMDVSKILTELREEREQIEEAILSLERLARGRGRRRGRPPSWMSEMTTKRRGRPPGSK